MRSAIGVLLITSLSGVAAPAVGVQAPVPGGQTIRDFPPLDVPSRTGVGVVQHKLSLDETIQMALANNLDIEIQKAAVDTAKEQITGARGFFDPSFRWLPLFTNNNTPTGSVLQGAGGTLNEKFLAQNFYLNQQVPWNGLGLQLGFENQRADSTNPFSSFSPYLSSRFYVGFTQPLLRNRLLDAGRAQIVISRKRADAATVDFETKVIDVITRVESAYWDLVAARQDVQVKEDSARWAKEQLAINKRFVESGTLAPVELSASEAELQRRLDTWYSSLGTLTEVENNLKTLIAPERIAEIWGEELIPTDDHTLEVPSTDDVRSSVEAALKSRPELRGIGVQQQINNVQRDLANDQRKPQMNIVGQYSLNGLGGTLRSGDNPFTAANAALYSQVNALSSKAGLSPLPIVSFGSTPDFLVGGYGTALANVFGGRYQSVQAGIQLDLSIHNRTANANYTETLISEKRLKLERARAEQAIEAQVRNAMQGIQTARQRIAAAEASAQAAKEKLESEQRLFQTGESTNFLVLTRQNESSDSRARVVAARQELNKSVARLEQALGNTLTVHNIQLKK